MILYVVHHKKFELCKESLEPRSQMLTLSGTLAFNYCVAFFTREDAQRYLDSIGCEKELGISKFRCSR